MKYVKDEISHKLYILSLLNKICMLARWDRVYFKTAMGIHEN